LNLAVALRLLLMVSVHVGDVPLQAPSIR